MEIQSIDMSGLWADITDRKNISREYNLLQNDGYIYMKSYALLPGVVVYYIDGHTKVHFCGSIEDCYFYQLSYSHEGVYESRIGGHRILKLSRGEILVLSNIRQSLDTCFPLGVFRGINIMFYPHSFTKETNQFMEVFSLEPEELFEQLLQGKLFGRFAGNDHVLDLLKTFYQAARDGDLIHMKLYLLHLLTEFVHYEGAKEQKYRYLADKNIRIAEEVKEFLQNNPKEHLTIRQLSARFHISDTGLKENFKLLYGLGPYEFLKQCRMDWAADLLKTTKSSVAEIGAMVGYDNPSKFSSAFFGVYGMTPSKYRKNV